MDGLPAEGILITKPGRPLAKVMPVPSSCSGLIGNMKGLVSNPKDDLFSTGVVWDAESGHSYSDQGIRRIPIKAFDGRLTLHEREVLTAEPERSISTVVLWEIAKFHRLGRVAYGLNNEAFAAAVDQVRVWPITRQVCVDIGLLDFQSDPTANAGS